MDAEDLELTGEEEAVMESEGSSQRPAKAPVRDAAGRRLKGRGAAAASLSMIGESGRFDSIENKGGSSRGPAKCEALALVIARTVPRGYRADLRRRALESLLAFTDSVVPPPSTPLLL